MFDALKQAVDDFNSKLEDGSRAELKTEGDKATLRFIWPEGEKKEPVEFEINPQYATLVAEEANEVVETFIWATVLGTSFAEAVMDIVLSAFKTA